MKKENKMKLLKSKIGYLLVGIYLVLSAISIYYSRVCIVGICDVGYLLLPAIPWIALLSDGRFNSTFIGISAYVISIIINFIIFYLIGYFISYLIKKNQKINKSKKRK